MDDQKIAYEMKYLQTALENIDKQLDDVAQRMANGALLAYPGEYRNPELFDLQKQCTDRVDLILDRIQKLQDNFRKPKSA